MRRLVLLLTLALCTACNEVVGPSVEFNEQFTLAPGETASVKGTRTSITFVGVEGDSRCPADAICIQGGDALVHVTATTPQSSRDYELHTGDMRPVQHEGLTIALVQVQPYPFSSRPPITPDDYRVTLKVTR